MKRSLPQVATLSAVVWMFTAMSLAPVQLGAQTAPDNSGTNKSHTVTADTQTDAKADRLLTAKIRRAIIADKSLSLYAHNVKIVALNGKVTLTGPVKSDEEKAKVAEDASAVTSADAVTNNLTVK